MPQPLKDRSATLFGRASDLQHLLARGEQSGITAVVACAQMGKSWLLEETARQFSLRTAPQPANSTLRLAPGSEPCLVGEIECGGETHDHLLRTVIDLYQRWLEDSTWREQATVVLAQQGDDLISKVASGVGSVVKSLSKIVIGPVGVAGELVKQALDALVAANQDLQSGGSQLPRLQYDQARDLVALLHTITGARIILVLDQWEKSPGNEQESRLLDRVLRHIDEWPPCHIYLGVREEPQSEVVMDRLRSLERDFPDWTQIFFLQPMQLDVVQAGAMLGYLGERVPFAKTLPPGDLLAMIDGYPRTLSRFISPLKLQKLVTLEAFKEVADEASQYLYPEFDHIHEKLDESGKQLYIRLALLSGTEEIETWKALKPVVLQGVKVASLDTLRNVGILESSSPPKFSHPKSREAALRSIENRLFEEMGQVIETLVIDLSASVRSIEPEAIPFAAALVNMQSSTAEVEVSPLVRALCASAQSLAEGSAVPADIFVALSQTNELIPAQSAALLAMGLNNTLAAAGNAGDVALRDTLLAELRTLTGQYPEDAAVREPLAGGLYNTLCDASEAGDVVLRDALLAELRGLAGQYPEDAAVRKNLAKGLYNTLNDAGNAGEVAVRDALLAELRTLAGQYPEDAAVRENLAMGLFSTLNDAIKAGEGAVRDTLLAGLRGLAGQYPEDAAVREQLAKALFNTLTVAGTAGEAAVRDALLAELRTLAGQYPEDADVRKRLAMGLFNVLTAAGTAGEVALRDALLAELRALAGHYPEDAAVRERLAKALFNTLNDAGDAGEVVLRDTLLAELRKLAGHYPEDAAVRENLAKGVNNTLSAAGTAGDVALRDALLAELGTLAGQYPEDAAVREQLANGLYNVLIDAIKAGEVSVRDALLADLRTLARQYPEDAAVRELLAMGLFNTLTVAGNAGEVALRDALLTGLRGLAGQYPEDAAVREQLANGLYNTLIDAIKAGEVSVRDALLAELRTLAGQYPEDETLIDLLSRVSRLLDS